MSDGISLANQEKKQKHYNFHSALRWLYHYFSDRWQNGIAAFRAALKWLYHYLFPSRWRYSIAIWLTREYLEKDTDTRYIVMLKRIANWFLLYFPLLYFLRLIQRFFSDDPYYPFEDEVILTTTRVIFTRSKRFGVKICLKLWQRTAEEVCDDQLIVRSDEYLLEGLAFNRKFAPGIYQGIASVTILDDKKIQHDKKIQRGSLIRHPREEQLHGSKIGERNALVMGRLGKHDQLEQQLKAGKVDAAFLACEVARMHRLVHRLSVGNVPGKYGTPAQILSKLELNIPFFEEAVNRLYPNGRDRYKSICNILKNACQVFAPLFEDRYNGDYIKRCHGDLKITNLWVCRMPHTFFRRRLLALDCIDFNPSLCHIDTLSDVAMLAVDLERFALPESPGRRGIGDLEQFKPTILPQQKQTYSFLHTYLKAMQEDIARVEPLLEYYMTEKAIVCTYVSILFDTHNYDLGRQYLQIACIHAQRLDECIKRTPAIATPAAAITPTETIQGGLVSTVRRSDFQ